MIIDIENYREALSKMTEEELTQEREKTIECARISHDEFMTKMSLWFTEKYKRKKEV